MKKEMDDFKKEKEKIDGYIITTCITLIGSFIIISSIRKPENIYLNFSYIISILSLVISLLSSLWHKLRYAKRSIVFEQEKTKTMHTVSNEICDFAEDFMLPTLQADRVALKKADSALSDKEIKKLAWSKKEVTMRNTIGSFLKNMDNELREAHEKTYDKPLNEEFSKPLFFLDKASQKVRYASFVIGIAFYLFSIIFALI